MPLVEFKQGSVICTEGDALQSLSLIVKGVAETSFNGKQFRYEKGDVLGLCDLHADSHSHTYYASSDVTAISYSYDGIKSLDALLRTNADAASHLVDSMCRQISAFLIYEASLKAESDRAYRTLTELYPQYESLCKLYALTPKKLSGISEIACFSEADLSQLWMHGYYTGISTLGAAARKVFFHGNPGISFGFLCSGAEDFSRVSRSIRAYQEYMTKISTFFIDSGGHDLFALISELHLNSLNIKGADAAVGVLAARLTELLSGMTGVDPAYFLNRLSSYNDALDTGRASKKAADAPDASGIKRNLSDSLNTILTYSGCPEELCNKFTQCTHKYTKLSDRTSSDADTGALRKELTSMFYEIYKSVFIKSLKDPALSTIIKMFLNFGYVDAALAGPENADYLYSIADLVRGDPENGVYTFPEWLTAIYNGQKEPSRNEFDVDYAGHVKELKSKNGIDAREEARMMADTEAKLLFELENLFPLVNKMTFGRITTFCPLFADHNVLRKIENSRVTPSQVKEKLDEILSIDFSAYYRETLYMNTKCDVTNEHLHVEKLPDIILMPNVGSRATLWQDIEGKNRTTPARMFLSIFQESDLKALLIQLTGEFRWEICKRVQGVRWNDVTSPSLTSVFSDYIQFYKSNRELSPEARDAVKIEYDRAKRNNKLMFVSNYSDWIMYESNGTPRLNKLVLQMMVNYCPLSAAFREKLAQYPRYSELLKRYELKQQKRAHQLSNLIQLVNRATKETPQELLDEIEYTKK